MFCVALIEHLSITRCGHQPEALCVLCFRKKKKDKESKHRLEQVATSQTDEEVKGKKAYIDKRTPAQIAFDKMQEKRVSCYPALVQLHRLGGDCFLENSKSNLINYTAQNLYGFS